jgi:hypothetical protein
LQQHQVQPAQLPHMDLPQHGGDGGQLRTHSPSPLDLFSDPFGAVSHANGHLDPFGHEEDDLLRIPSPPPLPADWDVAPRAGMLFDFDQFDASKKHLVSLPFPACLNRPACLPVCLLSKPCVASVARRRWRACADAGVPVPGGCSFCLLPCLPIVPLPHTTAHASTPGEAVFCNLR